MSRRSKALGLLFVLICLISLVLLPHVVVKAQTRTFVVPDQYSTIQGAINHANASDTVLVKHGLYKETLVINKPISLIGEGQASTIIDGNGGYNTIINVNASHVLIQGFTLTNTHVLTEPIEESDGIKIDGAREDIRIDNNTLTKIGGTGISLDGASSSIFLANLLVGTNIGGANGEDNNITLNVFLGGGEELTNQINTVIADNYFGNVTGNFGLYLDACDGTTVSGNTFAYNKWGIELESSTNGYFYNNNFINNSIQVSLQSNAEPSNGINTWDNSTVGNYWSDYTGNGSQPYAIIASDSGQAVYYDYHPLSIPFNGSAMPSLSLLQLLSPSPTSTRTMIAVDEQVLIIALIAVVVVLSIVLLIYRRHRKTSTNQIAKPLALPSSQT
ncbi:MAG: NosD domain-containing protein [Candidatus Bathyarchaeia archaeon]|jgi:nitrous oxidase accessory protein